MAYHDGWGLRPGVGRRIGHAFPRRPSTPGSLTLDMYATKEKKLVVARAPLSNAVEIKLNLDRK